MEVFSMKKRVPNNHIDRKSTSKRRSKEITKKYGQMAYILHNDPDFNKEERITQQKIGDMFDVSQQTISRWEHDYEQDLKISVLAKEVVRLHRIMGINDNDIDDDYNVIDIPEDDFRQLPDNSEKKY